MGLWTKSLIIFNSIREYGKQSTRRLAEQTGFAKSSVHRHLQAMNRRDRYPESWLWETEPGRTRLLRLVATTLFVFGLKRGIRVTRDTCGCKALQAVLRILVEHAEAAKALVVK